MALINESESGYIMRASVLLIAFAIIVVSQVGCSPAVRPPTGSVIFIHPDGAAASTWATARAVLVGPDNDLNWDKLPEIATYREHVTNSLTASSNAGGTIHATGVKTRTDAYGRSAGGGDGRALVDDNGNALSVARQAIRARIPVGLVQSGTSTEPGTGCFLVETNSRHNHDEIALQLIHSDAHVLLGGGERYFLPEGTRGVHGRGTRTDGRNLIEEARERGYTVVRTRGELRNLPDDTTRVLGLFAAHHTFNEATEETLHALGKPQYDPEAPTVAEMTALALRILAQHDQFLLIVEEEGTDNFANHNNASATIEACRRADEAIGLALDHLARYPHTLILTAADSNAGGMHAIGLPLRSDGSYRTVLPAEDSNGAPLDGIDGKETAPFLAKPDQFGTRLPFAISWAAGPDVSGGIIVRAAGLHSERVRGSMDNTDLAPLMRYALFGNERGPE